MNKIKISDRFTDNNISDNVFAAILLKITCGDDSVLIVSPRYKDLANIFLSYLSKEEIELIEQKDDHIIIVTDPEDNYFFLPAYNDNIIDKTFADFIIEVE